MEKRIEDMNLYSGLSNNSLRTDNKDFRKITLAPKEMNIEELKNEGINFYSGIVNILGSDCSKKSKIYRKEYGLDKSENLLNFLREDIEKLFNFDYNRTKIFRVIEYILNCITNNIKNRSDEGIYINFLENNIQELIIDILSTKSFEYLLGCIKDKKLLIGVFEKNNIFEPAEIVVFWKNRKTTRVINPFNIISIENRKDYIKYKLDEANIELESIINLYAIFKKGITIKNNEKTDRIILQYVSFYVELMININKLLEGLFNGLTNKRSS